MNLSRVKGNSCSRISHSRKDRKCMTDTTYSLQIYTFIHVIVHNIIHL